MLFAFNSHLQPGKLMAAAQAGDVLAARILLQGGADVNEVIGYSKDTPLIRAAWYRRVDMARFLLDNGADIEAKDDDMRTPLIRAAEDGHMDIVKVFVERGANIQAVDKNGKNVLAYALEHGNSELTSFLLAKGAKHVGYKGCLTAAAHGGDVKTARILLQGGADVNEVIGYSKDTPLIRAAWYRRVDMARFLLDNGADIEAKGYEMKTPLIRAAEDGHMDIVKVFVERGANIQAVDKNGKNVLAYALEHGNSELTSFLLAKGAKHVGYKGCLTAAARGGDVKTARILLQGGADVNEALGFLKYTPLHQAAYYHHVDMVRFLLDNGANIEARDYSGRTALMRAADSGDEAMVRLLVQSGANINAKDDDGKTALDYAEKRQNAAVIKILKGPPVKKVYPAERVLEVIVKRPVDGPAKIIVEPAKRETPVVARARVIPESAKKSIPIVKKPMPTDALADIIAQKDCKLARAFFDAAFWQDKDVIVSPEHLKMALVNDDRPMMRLLIHWGAAASREDLDAWCGGNKELRQKYQQSLRLCGLSPKGFS